IYSRFWHRFLYDIGVVPTKEPYAKRTAQGLILGPDGDKMSKSKGNVIDPIDVVNEYGADVLRTYVLFMGDYEKAAPWSESSVKGCKRFLDRTWALQDILVPGDTYSPELEVAINKTIKKVTEDIEGMKFNTAIAALMTLINDIYDNGKLNNAELKAFVTLLYPFAPHITEEIWEEQNFGGMLANGNWLDFDADKCVEATIEIVAQVNGKIRAKLNIAADAAADEVIALAKADEKVAAEIAGKTVVKELYVPGRLVNIVVE
ncbi:MAG: class I tRNA ligase family protein, partial [Clostridia bacterium]|nr:class I tRNA ligase family protein [Clostridia bacterium]